MPTHRADAPKPPRRVLVLRLSALGDVVMMLPLLRQAAESYPEVEWVVVSQAHVATLFSALERVRFIPAYTHGAHKGLRGLWQLAKTIHAAGPYEGVADMHSVLRAWIICLFLRLLALPHHLKLAHIDKGRRGKRALCRAHHKLLQPQTHSMIRYSNVLAQLGFLVNVPKCSHLIPQHHDLPHILELLAPCRDWVGIAPFAKHPGKMYPLAYSLAVAQQLYARGYGLCLFGAGNEESRVLEAWHESMPRSINVAALHKGLDWEVALMQQLEVMFTMDSANLHLASWAGIPVVSFWGATHPYAGFYGWGQAPQHSLGRQDLDCRPCSVYGNRPCRRGDYACKQMPPARIVEVMLSAIK